MTKQFFKLELFQHKLIQKIKYIDFSWNFNLTKFNVQKEFILQKEIGTYLCNDPVHNLTGRKCVTSLYDPVFKQIYTTYFVFLTL